MGSIYLNCLYIIIFIFFNYIKQNDKFYNHYIIYFFLSNNVLTLNIFLFHIVYIETNREGTYLRPIINENGYLNIMTFEDKPKENIKNRYILKFDINSAIFIKKLKYKYI